ncbi:NAD(P)H-hydrate dehydratase [Rhodovulum sp. DZ06]|uniref:NAD(P)H-hydrate dehydratase n=1 Tax=Rhodovulum sp. DZ06 TaxID=3425126 RepID=UPI003D33A8B0
MELLSAARMRAIEGAEIESGAVSGLELMERAAAGVAAQVPAGIARALVLCGPGNNGGDGYAAARMLAARGVMTEVFEMTDSPAAPDAAANRAAWVEGGGVAVPLGAARGALREISHGSMARTAVIDALFGTGLGRPLSGEAAALVEALNAIGPGARPFVLSVDIPSGLCADSGRALGGLALRADLAVSFHGPKLGHHLAEGPAVCGALAVADIGLAAPPPEEDGVLSAAEDPLLPAAFAKLPHQHKYDHGHALVLAGGVGKGGAARLAARAALRTGAGLVTVAPPPSALIENASRLDAVMLRRCKDAEDLSEILEDPRINAIALGMGLGATGDAKARLKALAAVALKAGRAAVVDADALTAWRDGPGALFDLLHPGCVLTPHWGEFRRLFPDIAERYEAAPDAGPAFSRVDAARAAARRAGCTVLLKGPDTVVATHRGGDATRASVHAATYERAAPWLGTAGAGDVLAGIIAALLARGAAPHDAACRGAWLHAEAARAFGPGLVAEDLPEMIPRVLAR